MLVRIQPPEFRPDLRYEAAPVPYAVFFGVLCAACLIGALAALWGSLRAAFGGETGARVDARDDTPEHAALLDEKTALLRAIKDLQYEHQVGKLDQADFERLDRAYRARAKEVLELLDRDVRPYRARAEALLLAAIPAPTVMPSVAIAPKAKKKKRRTEVEPEAAPTSEAAPEVEAKPVESASLGAKLEALSPEKRAQAEAYLAQLAQEPGPPPAPSADDEADEDDEETEERRA
jgi:hypothetical protein